MSQAPAAILGVKGGSLAPGSVGDVTLLDLDVSQEIVPQSFVSKGKNTPFEGWELVGRAVHTIVAGHRIYSLR